MVFPCTFDKGTTPTLLDASEAQRVKAILVDDFSDVVESDESSTVLDFEIVEVLDGICKLLECDNDDNAEVIPLPDVPVVSVEIIEMLGVVLDEG